MINYIVKLREIAERLIKVIRKFDTQYKNTKIRSVERFDGIFFTNF